MPANTTDVLLRELRTFIAGRKAEGQTDQDLLEQFLSHRDEASFAALLERHGPMVLGVCRRVLHDEHLAEDAFQAAFLVLAHKATTIRKKQSVGSWLHGVALRLARKAKAEAARSKHPDVRSKSQAAADPQAEASWHEAQQILDDELQRLPEQYRLPLILCYLEGLTRDEAAAQLGWSAGKLKGLLDRGREQLRSQLVRRGVTMSAAGAATLLADTVLSASVPPLLTVSTIHAATRLAAGVALAACGISAPVIALTQGGLKMMASKTMTVVVALVLVASLFGAGVGIVAQRAEPVEQQQPDTPPALAITQKPPDVQEAKGGGVDRLGDALPPDAPMRLGTSRFRQAGTIFSLAYSVDGKMIATGNAVQPAIEQDRAEPVDAGVVVWDADTGHRVQTWLTQSHLVRSVAFSPDAKRVVVVNGYGKTHLYDVESGKELRRFDTKSPEQALITPDGSTLLIAENKNVPPL